VGTYKLAAGNTFRVALDTRAGKVVEMKGEVSKPLATPADYEMVGGYPRERGRLDRASSTGISIAGVSP
jgi:hypothetical protein